MKKCKYCRKELPEFLITKKFGWRKGWYEIKRKSNRIFCDKKCSNLFAKYGVLVEKDNKGNKTHIDKKGFYLEGLDSYKNQLIDYPDAPTGKAYIGISKEPLMPNKKGFGFEGVLLQDESRQFMQCASCGKWVKKLTARHLENCGKMTVAEYKKKFGLYPLQGLVSDETSLKLTNVALKNKERQKDFAKKFAGCHKHQKRANKNRMNATASRQWQNKYGTCPEQLKARLREFILVNREFPNSHNRGGAIYKALVKRFGNWNAAMLHYGLPTRKRIGTNIWFTFPDHTKHKYNINKIKDRAELFGRLISKCKFLTEEK